MLKASNVSYRYLDRLILDDISLEFPTGNLFGILGPNGSGKTTFMKTLAGLWMPSHGKILWCDQDLLALNRKQISRIVTFVPQNPQLSFEYTVEDFVHMGRYAHHDSKPEFVKHCLRQMDALHLRARQVQLLSSGERQRIYIARALATEAPILLLDEPTASLDIRHQLEIWHLLRGLVMEGKIIIVTNHDLEATQRFCDRVAIFSHGKCLHSGQKDEVLTPEILSGVFGVTQSPLGYVLANR